MYPLGKIQLWTIDYILVLCAIYIACVRDLSPQGINDGAGALVLASEEALVENEKLGLKPLARVVGYEAVGCKPSLMGIGPVGAIRLLLQNAGLTLEQIDLFEVNEVLTIFIWLYIVQMYRIVLKWGHIK